MCQALAVSKSGYYDWKTRPISKRDMENQKLVDKITHIHDKSRRTYGSPRIHAELNAQGAKVGLHRVERLMQQEGIRAKQKKKFRKTTDSNHDYPIAPNLLERHFEVNRPNQVWVADLTYIWTNLGWLYLAVILDLYSRRVIGWAMDTHMRDELTLCALEMAVINRGDVRGVIHHSDRGSQYASNDYRNALEKYGLVASMSRKGDVWDNAVAESFFGSFKQELVHDANWQTPQEAKPVIFDYIEIFYNRQRRHSHNAYLSPAEYEKMTADANSC